MSKHIITIHAVPPAKAENNQQITINTFCGPASLQDSVGTRQCVEIRVGRGQIGYVESIELNDFQVEHLAIVLQSLVARKKQACEHPGYPICPCTEPESWQGHEQHA